MITLAKNNILMVRAEVTQHGAPFSDASSTILEAEPGALVCLTLLQQRSTLS